MSSLRCQGTWQSEFITLSMYLTEWVHYVVKVLDRVSWLHCQGTWQSEFITLSRHLTEWVDYIVKVLDRVSSLPCQGTWLVQVRSYREHHELSTIPPHLSTTTSLLDPRQLSSLQDPNTHTHTHSCCWLHYTLLVPHYTARWWEHIRIWTTAVYLEHYDWLKWIFCTQFSAVRMQKKV